MGNSSRGKKQSAELIEKRISKVRGEKGGLYGKKGADHPKFGKKQIFTEEHKRKLSESHLGRIRPEHEKEKLRVPKGPQKLKICPHCGKEGGNAMLRWHFDNCKNKKI